MCSGFSEEADRARRLWANLILEVEAAGPVAVPKEKIFKPKFPRIPVLDDYTKAAPKEFWAEFPEYYVCPAKPSLNGKKLKRWADALGCSEPDRLNRVLECIRSGADIGCRGEARKPSRSKNAASAFQYGPQVTDAIAEWVQKGYAYGPVAAEDVPAAAKVSGIMVRPKPNGSVRVILNLSAPKGRSVNDGIDKTDFPATMSSTAAWLAVLDTAGRGCLMTKTDWAAAYKHVWVREQDTDLQWFSWGGRFFKELCLIFGGVSSAGLFDDPAKILLDLVCRRAGFPRAMVCQHLDDVCAAAAAGSDTLYRFDAAFKELAADIGVELAPRDDHDKSFAPCTAGVVFGVHYDTVAWTWAIPDEKLARTCMLLEEAIAAGSMAAKQIRSLVGKLIHVKPLVPAGRFNMDKIMRVYRAAARTEEHVAITSACTRQFRFWYLFLRVCSGRVDIPRPQGRLTAGALDAFTDAAGGSSEAVGRGTGGGHGGLVVVHPLGQADQRRWLESRREESWKEVVRPGAGGTPSGGGRRTPGVPGADAAGMGGQRGFRGGVPQGVQPELPALYHLGQGNGHGGRRHRLPAGGDQNHQMHGDRGHVGGPAVQGQVRRLQADGGPGGVAAAAGAGQNTRGAVEVAGQAVPVRQAGGGHIGGAEHKQQAGRLHPWIYLAVIGCIVA